MRAATLNTITIHAMVIFGRDPLISDLLSRPFPKGAITGNAMKVDW